MPDNPKQLMHRAVPNAAVPYAPSQNPISESISLNAGSDLIAVIDGLSDTGWYERRPGWALSFETSATTFGVAPSRMFAWRRWGAEFYVMANVITGGNSLVYKLKVGTDSSFVLLYTSTGSTQPFDFVVSNNFIYFSDGTNAQKWNGTTLTAWGIAAPTAIPGACLFGIGSPSGQMSPSFGYKYAYCYGNSSTGHLSAPSYNPNTTGAYTGKTVEVIVNDTADSQVDKIHVFRSTDGGDGIFFELPNSPFGNNSGNVNAPGAIGYQGTTLNDMSASGTYNNSAVRPLFFLVVITAKGTPDTFKWSEDQGATYHTGVAITGSAQLLAHGISITFAATTGHGLGDFWAVGTNGITDNAVDTSLQLTSYVTAPSNINQPPPAMYGVRPFASRIWGFKNDTVFFSGFEEVISGVEEECFPTSNTFGFASEVQGIEKAGDALLVMTADGTHKITGNSLDTFRLDPLFGKMGTRQRATLTPVGNSLAWLDGSGCVRLTDGFTQQEIGKPIRADLAGIDTTLASMCYHTDGKRQFLMLLDGGASKVRVFDLDLQVWMPPWSVGGKFIASLETSVGTWQLLLAHSSGKVMKNAFNAYTDNGSTYTPSATHQLVGLVKDTAGYVGTVEYVSVESDGTQPATVQLMGDEDPSTGSFTDITANAAVPSFRTQGTNLKEVWYYARTSPAPSRRISVKFTWANSSANFKLYGWDIASLPQEQ